MPARDNQNRDLDAFARQLDADQRRHELGSEDAHQRHLEILKVCPYAGWTRVEGILCLRSGDSNFVAVPANDADRVPTAEKSSTFQVISLSPREHVTTLKRVEVRNWLWRAHMAEKGI